MKNSLLIICISLFVNLAWSQYEGFEISVTLNNPNCHGFTDGSINMVASGGVSPYEYEMTDMDGIIFVCPGGTGNILDDGCYIVIVTDAVGCLDEDTVCLVDPDPITTDLLITNPIFPGACNGIVEADTVYGYQGAYASIGYFWTIPGVAIGSEVTDVCAGEYTLTINDEYGCSGVFDFALGSLAQMPTIANSNVQVFSNQSTGELMVENPNGNKLNIKLLNIAGEVMFDSGISTGNPSYSPNLNSGMYLYTITQNQEIIQIGKLAF